MGVRSMIQVDLLSDLKAYEIPAWVEDLNRPSVFLMGRATPGDGFGGLYQFDQNSTAPEDLTFMNVLTSNTSATGRWVRSFQRVKVVPQGIVVYNGNVKTLYVNTVTNASGEAVINLTMDNTTTGPSVFTTVMKNVSHFTGDAPNISSAVQSYVKIGANTTSYKTTTHGYYKVQAINILLGGIISPIASVGAGVPVVFEVVGV